MTTETIIEAVDTPAIQHQKEFVVIKRNGSNTAYTDHKITLAVTQAFIAVEGQSAAQSSRVHQKAKKLASTITESFKRRLPAGSTIHIETIQDMVELALMRSGEHQVARAYVLYREERKKGREAGKKTTKADANDLMVTMANGEQQAMTHDDVEQIVRHATQGIQGVDASVIVKDALRNTFQGIKLTDFYQALIMAARTLVETDTQYTYVTARLLLHTIEEEVLSALGLPAPKQHKNRKQLYVAGFKSYIQVAIEAELLDPALAEFDLDYLANAIQPERDHQFTYLGLQTLYDRYFIHRQDKRIELPQTFFMRVAMGLALAEPDNREQHAVEFYDLLSSFDYMSSTPTLFNAGTLRSQLSSCFLTTVPDDLDGIYGSIKDNALLSKFAGGIGNDWTPVRGMGARIKGTNGKSQGVVPFMNVADATAIAVNQGGKRKGAVCAYLETWHIDIDEFLDLRKNTGDDRRRTHDMNTANWIPDLFIQRVIANRDWTLFSPNDVPGLHDKFGLAFQKAYEEFELAFDQGQIPGKRIKAKDLWRKMLGMLYETGHPWMTFKDPCNLRSPQQHVGVVHSSNLCTEITLNTSKDEIAVCNLGSINLVNHVGEQGLDLKKLEKTTKTAMRMLDNVIDINYYTVPQARNSNMKHRPVGMGLMGFQDALYKQGLSYASDDAIQFADRSMEAISYYAILASSTLAKERGAYESYEGSLWDQGILPIDSIEKLRESRGGMLEQNNQTTMDWGVVRKHVAQHGMRNSNVMAIAPTATISNICGVSQSIEPTYQNLFVKANMSGDFTVINPYLVADLKALGLWDAVMVNDLKYYDGSVQAIDRIPEDIKHRYQTAFELDPEWYVESASRRQKWIDQAQSLNLYMAKPSGKKLDELYRMAWLKGLKTTYYLRSMGATNAEKSTIADGALNAVPTAPKACSIDDPDCEACQ